MVPIGSRNCFKNGSCPGGEIGRRTVFRSQRSQGCAGSSPVLGTFLDLRRFFTESPFLFLLNRICEHMVIKGGISKRKACKAVSMPSSNVQFKCKQKHDEPVIDQLKELVDKHPYIGFWQRY